MAGTLCTEEIIKFPYHTIRFSELAIAGNNIALAAAGLLIACVSLWILMGNIGFQGDDWWILSFPYWHRFPESILIYARELLRPLEGTYWITLFELFGFNSQAFHLASLMLHAVGCVLMGACLVKAFPGKQNLAVWSIFFAFLLPTVSNLTYIIHTDNSRISVLLFWASVISFQRWTEQSQSWTGLLPGIIWYLLASLTYENTTLLIFSIPLFLWPIYVRNKRLPEFLFLFRLLTAIAIAFAGFIIFRFALLSGGAVAQNNIIPSIYLVYYYIQTFQTYFLQPFISFSSDKLSWVWGGVIALFAGALALRVQQADRHFAKYFESNWTQTCWYVAAVGTAVTILGLVPYLLAGYTADVGYHSQSRIYSAGSFGAAILAALVATAWKNRRILWFAQITAIMGAMLMAVFMADLRNGWANAAENRRQLCSSLLAEIPDVQPETNFLFLDLQWYIDNKAAVFQGVEGLKQFIRIIYNKKNLNAYFLYSERPDFVNAKGRKATVSPEGVLARGSVGKLPAPLDKLLILRRQGNRLHLVDRISADDHLVAMDWCEVSAIYSNNSLIIPASINSKIREHVCLE